MDAKEFLQTKGIKKENTTLIVYIEGAMRQPNLQDLMEEYANLKVYQSVRYFKDIENQLKK
jgi:hypothetical protein